MKRKLQLAACIVALAAAFVLSGTTWIEIGRKSGYGDLSWVLICAFDAYMVTALISWWSPRSDRSEAFARRSVYGMTVASSVTQGIYHSAKVLSQSEPQWQAGLALIVGLAIPIVAALTVHSLSLAGDVPDAEHGRPAQLDATLATPAPSQSTPLPAAPAPAVRQASPAASLPPAAEQHTQPSLPPQRRPAAHAQPANPRGLGAAITIADVQAGISAGKSPKEIATQYGVHVATVHRRQREALKQRVRRPLKVAR